TFVTRRQWNMRDGVSPKANREYKLLQIRFWATPQLMAGIFWCDSFLTTERQSILLISREKHCSNTQLYADNSWPRVTREPAAPVGSQAIAEIRASWTRP